MSRSTHRQRYEVFLTQLREARQSAGVTQSILAQRLGKPQTFISKCERGERRLDAVDLIDFLDAYGVASADFMAELHGKLRQPAAATTAQARRKRPKTASE